MLLSLILYVFRMLLQLKKNSMNLLNKFSLKSFFILAICYFSLASTAFADSTAAKATESEIKPGQILGGADVEFPDWFKESFLDFREDAAEAAENR